MRRASNDHSDPGGDYRADAPGPRRDKDRGAPLTEAGRVRLRTLDQLDQRTHAVQAAKHLITALQNDLGGPESLSAAQVELTRRAGFLSAILQDHEVRWLERDGADLSQYSSLVARQCRVLEALGLSRVPRPVTGPAVDMTAEALAALEALP